ncbi:AraC family transcriptional regulator [Curtobacterium sp. 1544]|uniref:AraC family transcriptional regulator n=1 Tax=Curtobacterium sp. 1544 TaxID=3156417 RepID=UPI0033999071
MDDLTAQHLDRAAAIASAHAAVLGTDHHAASARAGSAHRADALGLTVSEVHEPTGPFDRRYVPSLSVVLRGRKRSIVGDDDQVWGRERFIITPVDLPVVAGVVDTAGDDGFVSAVWRLDPAIVGEVVSTMSARAAPAGGEVPRLGTWTAPLADAFARLLALLDAPEECRSRASANARVRNERRVRRRTTSAMSYRVDRRRPARPVPGWTTSPCCSPSSPARSSSVCSRPNRHRASPPRSTAPAPPSSLRRPHS